MLEIIFYVSTLCFWNANVELNFVLSFENNVKCVIILLLNTL